MLIVIDIIFVLSIFLSFAIQHLKRKRDELSREIAFARQFKPFSTADYLSRREQMILDLMEQREKEESYIITLWLGLDGLQINEDGSTEWVSRRKADEKSVDSGLAQILQNSLNSQIEAMQLQQMRSQLQSICAYQNMKTQSVIQYQIAAQCQNTILPAYPTHAPLFMTQNTPYLTYSAGGYCGTYRYWQ